MAPDLVARGTRSRRSRQPPRRRLPCLRAAFRRAASPTGARRGQKPSALPPPHLLARRGWVEPGVSPWQPHFLSEALLAPPRTPVGAEGRGQREPPTLTAGRERAESLLSEKPHPFPCLNQRGSPRHPGERDPFSKPLPFLSVTEMTRV